MRILWLLAVLAAAGGQELSNLRPDQAVDQALRGHPLLASSQARIQGAQGERQQASLRPNPRLYLQSENTRFGSSSTPFQFTQETDNFAYVSQVLEAPGKRDSRIQLGGQVVRRREAELDVLRARIAHSVAGAYWSAVGAERVRDILKQSLENFDQTVQYHRDRVREGALAEVDLIRVEVEREQVSVELQNAEQEVQRLRLQLFREMGEPVDRSDVVLTGHLDEVRPFIGDSPDDAVPRRPDVRLARQLIEQANAKTNVEKANAKPDPEILFGYKRTTGLNTMIAGIQLPLTFRNRNQGAIAASLAETKAAEYDGQSVETSARSEIASAQSEYQQKLRLVTASLPKIREQAEDTVRIARAAYREGASELLRLLDAERTGLHVQLLFVRTLIDYQIALVNLKAATGVLP